MIDERDSTNDPQPPVGESGPGSAEAQSGSVESSYTAAQSDAAAHQGGDGAHAKPPEPPEPVVDAAGEGMVAADVAPQAAVEAHEPVTGGMPAPESANAAAAEAARIEAEAASSIAAHASPAEEPSAAAEETSESAEETSEAEAAEPAEKTAEEPAEAVAEAGGSPEPAASPSKRNGRKSAAAADETSAGEEPIEMDWYILKVQSNREETIADGLRRRAAIAGLENHFGEVIVPTEMVTEFKGGKKKVVKRKLYPGYIVVHMHINEDTWFLVRDTPGIGDFTGAGGKPIPMQEHEISRLIAKQEEKTEEAPKLKISFKPGDRVKINEGTFENFEGDVDSIDQTNGRVTVMINIFGRSTPVELEYWQIENV
ncbi:MAG: transcription termination/antitermination protein NusG [Pirellulales bacterium]